MIPGMVAFALAQKGLLHLENSDAAFPTLVSTLLPAGLKGVVVGGLMAALMSSLASLFNSTATLFTVDFYKRYRPDTSEKKLVFVGRVATAVVVVLGIVWIPLMKLVADVLYEYIQNVQSLIAPGIAAVFIMGVFSKKTTGTAGLVGLITGFVLGMFRLVLMIFQKYISPESILGEFLAINWLHYCVILFIISIAVIWIVTQFTKKPDENRIKGLVYGSASPEQVAETRSSWNHWDVFHTAIVLGVVVCYYIYFW
jgi:SSS family solute:Na+ symporter